MTITDLFPHGSPVVVTRTIGPHATRRESVNTDIGPDKVAAAVVSSAARIIRRMGAGGVSLGTSRSFGNASPGTAFYFAQDYSNDVFRAYLAFANPGSADAHVRVTFAHRAASTARGPSETFTVPAHARVTRNICSDMWRAMAVKPVGLIVRSDQPIVTERVLHVANGVGTATYGATASALKLAPSKRRPQSPGRPPTRRRPPRQLGKRLMPQRPPRPLVKRPAPAKRPAPNRRRHRAE